MEQATAVSMSAAVGCWASPTTS